MIVNREVKLQWAVGGGAACSVFFCVLREREIALVLDEKSIPASEIEVSWATRNAIPHSVPTWFQFNS
jgi:hypothetical protein